MPIEDYAYLWDGSESGWSLNRFFEHQWLVTFEFPAGTPTQSDIIALRKIVDELRNVPMSVVLEKLRGCSEYKFPQQLGNIEMKQLVDSARQLDLNVVTESIDCGGYLPISSEGNMLIIEDDQESEQVAQRMIAAGVPVIEVHVD